MRPVFEFRTASKENYQLFCDRNPKIKLSFKSYKKILYKWNEEFMLQILEGKKLKMPYGFGPLMITKYKRKTYRMAASGEKMINYKIDWVQTKKQGKYVYHMNYHSDGYNYYFRWVPHEANIKRPHIWKFKPVRKFSRLLSKYIQDEEKDYKHIYQQHITK